MAERLFFTGSTRIINDPRLSGLDLRVYACVSLHDGMSLLKKSGRGCYATFATLTGEIGCDAANLSRSLKRLVEWGYLTEERQDDRRRKTYRVTFDNEESWRNRQQSNVDQTANEPAEIVGNDESGNGGKLPQTEQHYSSLKGLDTPEGERLDSVETARFAARRLGKIEFKENVGAQLAKLEREFRSDRDSLNLLAAVQWLEGIALEGATCGGDEGRAARLLEEFIEELDEYDYVKWSEGIRAVAGTAHG